MKSFTIIGGGATGTLLAANLSKNSDNQPITVNIVEKSSLVGRGVAYSTANPAHLLNVPANKMGAFPDDVGGFYKWLKENNYDYFSNDFVPRKIYGEYLQSVFNEALEKTGANVSVNIFNDEAVDIFLENGQSKIRLKSGRELISDKVVLAFGNFLPAPLRLPDHDYANAEKYFANPWSESVSRDIKTDEDVLIIGTGLTMVDTVLTLLNRNHQGKILAISTHGWLPAVHELGFVYPSFADELKDRKKISELFKIVRRHSESAEDQKSNWRGVIDSLRPVTQEIWLNLPDEEKRRFMRHLRRIWDVSRHRMPGECGDILSRMQADGRLRILRGRVKNIERLNQDKFKVSYCDKTSLQSVAISAIINCTGSESDFRKLDNPFIKNLLARQYIQTDNLSLGVRASRDGRISENLYTIGTSLRGVLWESTAMPEIRAQARRLAFHLLDINDG